MIIALLDQFKLSIIFFPFLMAISVFLSKKFNFFDKPNSRKVHKVKVVNTSGIIIYLFLLFIVANSEFSKLIENIIIAGILVTFLGFLDDMSDLKPLIKIFFLIFPSGYLILNGFYLEDLGKYEYIGIIELGKFSLIFSILAVILLLNAINYIDGSDGLLIGNTIIAFSYLYFLSDKTDQYINIFVLFIYALTVSLVFNFLPIKSGYKSFLGNSGSLFIGFFLSFTLIYLYEYKNIHPGFLVWTCWLAIYDFLYVTFFRLKRGIKLSKPDKSHFHHDILRWFSNNHLKTFMFINSLNIIIILIGYVTCLNFGKIYSIILFIVLFIIFASIRIKIRSYIFRKRI